MSIEQLRATAAKYALVLSAILALSVCGIEYVAQGSLQIGAIIAVAGFVMLGANYFIQKNGVALRFTSVAVLMAQVMGLLVAAKGQAFQSDMHMAFFSALAFCALYYDPRPIIFGALLVVVHHLFLGMSFEELVFYGGASIERVVLHGVILALETIALVWMVTNTRRLLDVAHEKSALAESETQRTAQASKEREDIQTAATEMRETMVSDLRDAFGSVVMAATAGDFTRRIDTNFPDDELNMLADAVNELVSTVERGLSDTGEVLSALANYNLSVRVNGDYEGSFLQLKDNTNTLADRFTAVVTQIGETSRALKQATAEISSGANDLSERTTRQAASIQETSLTTDKLAETVRDNTERAKKAQSSITETRAVAERGGQVMTEANNAMQRITSSSSKISDIIGMIDDIAFQTNLLALNASVEAARAGEAGKGFAVVAVEVRRLAQSAATASSEVKVLIEQSATEVEGGTKLVSQAAENLDGIVESVRNVTTLMDEIAKESQEQAVSISDISHSIREMDQMTQHNAALVQQTNASIDKTETQATELDHMVEQFQVAGRRSSSAPMHAPAKPKVNAPAAGQNAAPSVHGNLAVKPSDDEWQEF